MRTISAIVLFAFVGTSHAEEKSTQGFADKLVNKLVDRALEIEALNSTDLENVMLAKGPAPVGTAQIQPRMAMMPLKGTAPLSPAHIQPMMPQPSAWSMQRPYCTEVPRGIVANAKAGEKPPQMAASGMTMADGLLWDAIIDLGYKQMLVKEGRWYDCHSLKGADRGSKVTFPRVLGVREEGKSTWGQPYVEGARVEAEVMENFKDRKIIVYKMKPKKHYRRTNNHRQHMTRFLVTKVVKPT